MKKHIQSILHLFGYYKVKSSWRWFQYLKRLQKEDAKRKTIALDWIQSIDHRLLPEIKKNGNVTVSMTSHGKRVAEFAPLAIYSIFQQTILPNRIVLNINQELWNDNNLPVLIKKLQIAGLEVNYCEDMGPHTKLLPSLQKFPDDIIITIDDDVYYEKGLVADLLSDYYQISKPCVICRSALVLNYGKSGIKPYSQWSKAVNANTQNQLLSPLGFCGVLYAPHIFSDEIFNKSVFQKHCKYADDIWFSVIEMKEQIPVCLSSVPHHDVIDVNHYNEYVAKGSDALHFYNNEEGRNDVQLQALVEYYNLNELMQNILNHDDFCE